MSYKDTPHGQFLAEQRQLRLEAIQAGEMKAERWHSPLSCLDCGGLLAEDPQGPVLPIYFNCLECGKEWCAYCKEGGLLLGVWDEQEGFVAKAHVLGGKPQ